MSKQIASYQPHQILELKKLIEAAFKSGEKQDTQFKAIMAALIETSPQAARVVPLGF
jgi:hypothetical protein